MNSLVRGVRNTSAQFFKLLAQASVAAGTVYLVDAKFGGLRKVHGPSMQPTLNPLLVPKFDLGGVNNAFQPHSEVFFFKRNYVLERGSVVFASHPRKGTKLVKRVVALPGDKVQPRGQVGQKEAPEVVTLAEGQVWVESDAGPGYSDSDTWGPLPTHCIHGTVEGVISTNRFFRIGEYRGSLLRGVEVRLSEEARARVTPAPAFL